MGLRDTRTCFLSLLSARRYSKRATICKSQTATAENCGLTLTASVTVSSKCLLFEPSSLWYSAEAALSDKISSQQETQFCCLLCRHGSGPFSSSSSPVNMSIVVRSQETDSGRTFCVFVSAVVCCFFFF